MSGRDSFYAARDTVRAAMQAMQGVVALLDATEVAPLRASSAPLPVFINRRQAKELLSLETKAFNRAGRELTFLKPGRELLLPTGRLVAWIESQPANRSEQPANDDSPLDFAEFRASVQKRAAR